MQSIFIFARLPGRRCIFSVMIYIARLLSPFVPSVPSVPSDPLLTREGERVCLHGVRVTLSPNVLFVSSLLYHPDSYPSLPHHYSYPDLDYIVLLPLALRILRQPMSCCLGSWIVDVVTSLRHPLIPIPLMRSDIIMIMIMIILPVVCTCSLVGDSCRMQAPRTGSVDVNYPRPDFVSNSSLFLTSTADASH